MQLSRWTYPPACTPKWAGQRLDARDMMAFERRYRRTILTSTPRPSTIKIGPGRWLPSVETKTQMLTRTTHLILIVILAVPTWSVQADCGCGGDPTRRNMSVVLARRRAIVVARTITNRHAAAATQVAHAAHPTTADVVTPVSVVRPKNVRPISQRPLRARQPQTTCSACSPPPAAALSMFRHARVPSFHVIKTRSVSIHGLHSKPVSS